jgi:hypothetical protein
MTRLQMNITKEKWKGGGKEEMEKLLSYVKEIELYNKKKTATFGKFSV